MDKYPLITIGVSAYNRANYLPFCLDSLLAQTYPNCEIIVIDDGSSDNTRELMQTKYPQIKYVYQENAGDAAAKNSRRANTSYSMTAMIYFILIPWSVFIKHWIRQMKMPAVTEHIKPLMPMVKNCRQNAKWQFNPPEKSQMRF